MQPQAVRYSFHGRADERAPAEILWWDGRLDNRADLLWRVGGSVGRDPSDSTLVLATFERGGIAALRDIVGDWSAVIRDGRTGDIILASDFAGVRPLYYHWRRGEIIWSSRLTALVAATGIEAIDERYAHGFMLFGGCPARTPYAGVESVPPGHAIRARSTGVTAYPFWAAAPADVLRYRDERRYDEQLRALFREAVAVRLQTHGVAMAELSGGFDSSSVVCMATHLIQRREVRVRALKTVSYEHRDSLDAPFIREVEALCGIEGIRLSTAQSPLIAEESIGNAMPEAWTALCRAVRAAARAAGATALLTGHNGDLVAGNWFDDSPQVAASLRRLRLGRACSEALAWSKVLGMPMTWILSRALRAALPASCAPAAIYAMDGLPVGRHADVVGTSLLPALAARTGIVDPLDQFSKDWMAAPPERRKHFQAFTIARELRTLQAPEPLQDIDYTHPFAHRPLCEFLMSVPAEALCRPGEPRRMMRRALSDLWPLRLRTRRSKSLFHTPWIEALRPLAVKLLATPRWQVVERGWVERNSLATRLERLVHGLACNEAQLRLIVMLEYWLRQRASAV
jgi:asparagine synthase (glutamine-hydrolysing)